MKTLTEARGITGERYAEALVFDAVGASQSVVWMDTRGVDILTISAMLSATATVTIYQSNVATPTDGSTTGAWTHGTTLTASGSLLLVRPADWTGIAVTWTSGTVTVRARAK